MSVFSNNFSKINEIFLSHHLWALSIHTNHSFPCFIPYSLFKKNIMQLCQPCGGRVEDQLCDESRSDLAFLKALPALFALKSN